MTTTDPDTAAFESALAERVQARDFDGWLRERSVYADWLEDRQHPLMWMARAAVDCHPVTVPVRGGGKRAWMWRLYFALPKSLPWPTFTAKPLGYGRWAANHRVNGHMTLGFLPSALRCKGFDDNRRISGDPGPIRWSVRFTAIFRQRPLTRIVRRRGSRVQEQVPVPLDTALDPCGFARMFWPVGWWPKGVEVPGVTPSLFEGV
jgi:hypothetical protein